MQNLKTVTMVCCLPEAAWNHRGVCQRLAPAGCLTVLAARKITKVLKCHHFPLQTERLWKILVASCVRVGPALKIGISLLFTACLQFNWTSVERVPEAFMGEMANCQANWLFFTEVRY